MAAILLGIAGCGRYDCKHPDTRKNRIGFLIMTGMNPDRGIKDIYVYFNCFNNTEAVYFMAFKATPESARRIIRQRDLKKQDASFQYKRFPVPQSVSWWDEEKRKKSDLYYTYTGETCMFCHFWYDPETGNCQFMGVCR